MPLSDISIISGKLAKLRCPERVTYISNSTQNLEAVRQNTIQEINYCLGNAHVKGIQAEIALKRRTDDQDLIIIPRDTNIYIPEIEIARQFFGPLDRGAYIPEGNKIVLNPTKWCRKTLLHECLHSVSIFSHPNNSQFIEKTLLFNEAVTEFLTGLLLFSNRTDCYFNWIRSTYEENCGIGTRGTSTIYAFCFFVDPQVLVDFYLGNQTNDIQTAWDDFTSNINRQTGSNFKNIFRTDSGLGFFPAFKYECERKFKKKFRNLAKSIDYEKYARF